MKRHKPVAKGFTNHEQTDPSGLIYMQARYYLPMYGRFASPDPARDQHFEQTQSWNIYSYVKNNPVTHFDPNGMEDRQSTYTVRYSVDDRPVSANLTAHYFTNLHGLVFEVPGKPGTFNPDAIQAANGNIGFAKDPTHLLGDNIPGRITADLKELQKMDSVQGTKENIATAKAVLSGVADVVSLGLAAEAKTVLGAASALLLPSLSNLPGVANWGVAGVDASSKPTVTEKVKDFATSVTPVLGTVKAAVDASKMKYELQFSEDKK